MLRQTLTVFFIIVISANITVAEDWPPLPSNIKAGGTTLVLNGSGMRILKLPMVTLNMYEAGLYVTGKTTDMMGLLDDNKMMALKLRIISRFINSERMTIAAIDGFEKSTHGHMEHVRQDLDRMLKVFSSDIERGDVYDLIYDPATGTKIYKNGEYSDRIEGNEFKKALFGIWIGDQPIQEQLRDRLAGLSVKDKGKKKSAESTPHE